MCGRVWEQVLERIYRGGASITLCGQALGLPHYGRMCERVCVVHTHLRVRICACICAWPACGRPAAGLQPASGRPPAGLRPGSGRPPAGHRI